MIEAVNALIANSSTLRVSTQQVDTEGTRNAQRIEASEASEPVLAPYVSPFIQVDNRFDTAVIQIRDSDTGDVLTQFPSEPSLRSRQAEETFLEGGREAQIVEDQRSIAEPASDSSQNTGATGVQTVTIAQSTPPVQSLGAGGAQAAIAALSTGALSGQNTQTATVQVQA